jgi:hypothetical protein
VRWKNQTISHHMEKDQMPYVMFIAQTRQLAQVATNMGSEWIQPTGYLLFNRHRPRGHCPASTFLLQVLSLHQHTGLKY